MAFKITARTLLELGAELIGSDAVALYELAKNSVDARSAVVRIKVQSVLPYSRYRQALDLIDDDELPLAEIRSNIEQWIFSDAPAGAARPMLLALDGAHDAQQFRQFLVDGYREINFVEVSDDGEGMSLEDLENIFLTIGTRSRREEKRGWDDRGEDPSRPLLGDKGVGRLSVMRLGEHLSVRTSKAGEKRWNDLSIDWARFSHDSDALLEDVAVAPERGPRKDDESTQGTTIRVSQLKGDWTRAKFGEMLDSEFSRMVDPFDRRRGNRLFRIVYNDQQVTLPQIPQRLFDVAHATVSARFEYKPDGQSQLVLDMDYRLNTHKKQVTTLPEVRLVSITKSRSTRVLRKLGSFKVEFLWFNRLFLTAVEGLGTKSDVQAMVRQWAGGLMVFRDGFRINPYGGGDDDWLQLDKKAFGRRGYKLNRQQVIGRVNLSWRNRRLVEQTNREGLVDNEYKEALVSILQKILEDFKTFSQNIEDELRQEDLTSVDVLKARVSKSKTEIQKQIRQIAVDAPEQAGPLKEVERLVQALASQIDDVDGIIDDYKDERRKFVHLAGLGLMVELILHELGRSSSSTLSTLEGVDKSQLAGKLPAVFQTLESQLRTLQKRIETLDPLSTSRRQTKEGFTIEDLVQQVVDARDAQAERHKVKVTINSTVKQPWRVRAVRGMLIQILENLLSNSFYWLKQQAVIDPSFRPRIHIDIDQDASLIEVSDNGPGIEQTEAERIFKPFESAKPPGEGNGLGLYIARELAEYHGWTLQLVGDPTAEIWRRFSLDLSGKSK
ncbi:sensor histidine kinase [Sphingomonas immobilis]|uniref:histidine kinase n=1 Tax=Sphingomonas immobilis TaxID=3063997 RepID=A0ABT9A145_9SPHN|nr:sensor histidine kinase [Sphingomonas sp. CA1-15]MDO7843551.1 sensor histidine kinase [Sphingomonas sp. CA1-15]